MLPDVLFDEVEDGDDVEGAELGACWFAVEEEVEQFKADGVSLCVEARREFSRGLFRLVPFEKVGWKYEKQEHALNVRTAAPTPEFPLLFAAHIQPSR